MNSLILIVVAALAVLGVNYVLKSGRRQLTAVALAWLVPGLGHRYLGLKKRGAILGSIVIVVFIVGMVMAGFRNISPFDRHPIWGIAHAFGGLMTGVATAATWGLKIEEDRALYNVGCLYSAVGTLLNLLLILDVHDHCELERDEAAAA